MGPGVSPALAEVRDVEAFIVGECEGGAVSFALVEGLWFGGEGEEEVDLDGLGGGGGFWGGRGEPQVEELGGGYDVAD